MESSSNPSPGRGHDRERWGREVVLHRMSYPDESAVRFLARNYGRDTAHAGLSALDIGCGSGRHTRLLASFGFRALGIDLASAAIVSNHEYYGADAQLMEFAVADLRDARSVRPEGFACVIAWGVLFLRPIDEIVGDLRLIYDMMLPGGRMLVNFRPPSNWIFGLGEQLTGDTYRLDARAREYEGVTYTFLSREQSESVLVGAGFEITLYERMEYWKNGTDRNVWDIYCIQKPMVSP
jgi:SAM-dependent methyltransferase